MPSHTPFKAMTSRLGVLRRPLLMLVLTLTLGGCSNLPLQDHLPWSDPIGESGNPQLDFWLQALASDGAGRERLWLQARAEPANDSVGELHQALLQSLDGHSGYDPVAADRRLRALRARKPSAEVESVARLRLAELKESRGWRHQAESSSRELDSLRQRLARLIDIERSGTDRSRPESSP